jgi:hypothetical protein
MDDERDREREPRSSRDRDISWSEIDKARDRSQHVRRDERRGRRKPSSVTGLQRYKSDLDALFERGTAGKLVKGIARQAGLAVAGGLPERQQALRAILDAVGPEGIRRAVDEFSAKFGELPDDPEVLTQALVHPDETRVMDAMQRLHRYVAGHVPPRKALLLQRVKEVESRSETPELRELASQVRDLLKG